MQGRGHEGQGSKASAGDGGSSSGSRTAARSANQGPNSGCSRIPSRLRTPSPAQVARCANDSGASEALSAAASSVYGVLRETEAANSREILTVAAQEEFVAPSEVFRAEPC